MIKENYILQWYNLVRLNNKKATFTSWIISEMCSVPVWPTNLGSSEIQIYYKLTSFASTLIMRNKSSRTQKVPNSLRLPRNMVLHFQETLHSTNRGQRVCTQASLHHTAGPTEAKPQPGGPSLSHGASTGQHTHHLGACKNAEYQASSQTYLTQNLHPMRSPESHLHIHVWEAFLLPSLFVFSS